MITTLPVSVRIGLLQLQTLVAPDAELMLLDRYLEVSQSNDVATFQSRLVKMAEDMGFPLVSAMLVVEDPTDTQKHVVHTVDNTPAAFAAGWKKEESIARDPVVQRLKSRSLPPVPFVYDQQFYVTADAGDIWEEQAFYGFKTGIAVALHLSNNQHYVLGVDRDQPLPAGVDLTRMVADLQLLAVYSQSAATKLLLPLLEGKQGVPKMNKRELEVLNWTRAGKTAWETGQILGLSEQGVHYYFRSIFQKLDVSTKHQAVLKAISLGILSA